MKRYILTGTPGSGKTSIIRALETKGHAIILEAATDVIANNLMQGIKEPWKDPQFIDTIMLLQKKRQIQSEKIASELQFYDRSPICTYALAIYLGFKPSELLLNEIERVKNIYETEVFFIENLGFCTTTPARTITFEESLIFEKIHEEAYVKFGYTSIKILAGPINDRVNQIIKFIA
jgi:predicted ATPase